MKLDSRNRLCLAVRAWMLCALIICAGACDRTDPDSELNAAAASFSAGDYQDASLRLNYVVQVEPDNIRARELRGDIALLLGDYASADSEFERAIELGAPFNSIALKLVEASIGQGLNEEALALLESIEPGLGNEPLARTLQAEALLAENRLPEAKQSIAEVEKIGESGARVLTTKAQIAFSLGDPAEAFNSLAQALSVAPNDPRVRLAHAELLARSERLDEAAAELQRAADLYREAGLGPRETLSLLGLVQVHLAQNDLGAAQAVAARLVQQAPQVQSTAYFQGLVNFRQGNYDEAAAIIQPLVNASPDSIHYRALLGAIQLARGNVGQAEQQFLRVLAISPRDPAAAKLLAETRLRQQRPDAALDALLAVQDTAAEDPQIGLLSGIATVLSGNAEQGVLYLEQSASLDPTNELVKLQLARAYLATGRDAEATNLLTGTFGDDAHAIEASLLQLYAASRRGDIVSSNEIAENLVADNSDDPRVLTAVAINYQLNGTRDRARELFERAAELETDTVTAQLFVAASLVQEGRQNEAENLLRQTMLQQSDNAQAMAGLAQLLADRGAIDEAAELFSRAAEHSDSVIPRLALAKMLLREGSISEAKQQLDLAAVAAPNNAEVIALNGIVALAEGRAAASVALLEQASELLPDRLGVSLALARARLANGQAEAARATLLRVLELAPRSFPIRMALGDAELQSGNAEGAFNVATDLKVDFPSQAGGYILEGKALMSARQYEGASESFSAAYSRQPTWPTLVLKIQALRLAGRTTEALTANEEWVADNQTHVPAGLMFGVLLQTSGRLQEALEAYEGVLRVAPDNLVALNNAAWVSHDLGEPRALAFAERAYDAGPDNSSVLDTLGWILLAHGQEELAIEHLSRAADLAPQSQEIRYHLSKALVAGGQSARAREMLTLLLSEKRDFDKRAQAIRLLESMQAEVPVDR